MAITPLPCPPDFGVSYESGFLSQDPPKTGFTDSYFQPWDKIVHKLPSLLELGHLSKEVDALPLLSAHKLSSELDYRRAYVVLGFLTHAIVWSKVSPNGSVPCQVAEPFLEVCEHLGLEPVLSYAGLCLWNWKYKNSGNTAMELENLECIASFTGTRDEDVFNLVPVLTEAEGGKLIALLTTALHAAQKAQVATVVASLDNCADSLVVMARILPQLYSHLNAHTFYHVIRPYLAGGKGKEADGLSQGMIFHKSDDTERSFKRAGGSAIQSSLFPFIDYALGIVHKPLDASTKETMFQEMRAYMPGAHRKLLEHISNVMSIRAFVETKSHDAKLSRAYNNCLHQLRSWRSKHIAVVSKYIVQPARAAAKVPATMGSNSNGLNGHSEAGVSNDRDEDAGLKGTGGTALLPFLKQARDETQGLS